MWVTHQSPCDFLDDVDHGQSYSGTPPPPGGTRMGVIEMLPGEHRPPLHRTDTLDYVICIAGEMGMLLDDGVEVFMKAGDIMIQRGTAHAWFNRGSEPARIAFVWWMARHSAKARSSVGAARPERCGISSLTAQPRCGSAALKDGSDALTAADAHGDQGIAPGAAMQRMDGLDAENRAGGADGVAECHGAAIGIDARRVKA
jgi:quercetin dioxygenase-like cupin family protein